MIKHSDSFMDCGNIRLCGPHPIWNTGMVGEGIFPLPIKWRRIQHLQDVRKSSNELVRMLENIRLGYVIGGQWRLCPGKLLPVWKSHDSWEVARSLQLSRAIMDRN